MKKIAIIVGGAGQDGTLLSQHLADRGYDVVGVARDDLNIENFDDVGRLVRNVRAAEIYFLAAVHQSSEAPAEGLGQVYHKSMRTHFDAPVNFMTAIATHSKSTRFLYAASSRVFKARQDGMQDEETSLEPDSVYGITKAAGMMACRRYRQAHGVFASVAILYNHESPLRKPQYVSRKLAMAAARIARAGHGTIEIGDLDARVDWGYAPDYIDAMHRVLSLASPDEFIVATGEGHTVKEFADLAFARVGLDYRNHITIKSSSVQNNTAARIGDSSKLRNATGWRPTIGFVDLVHRLVDAEIGRTNAP